MDVFINFLEVLLLLLFEIRIHILVRFLLPHHGLLFICKIFHDFFFKIRANSFLQNSCKGIFCINLLVFDVSKNNVREVVRVPRLGVDLEIQIFVYLLLVRNEAE